MINKLQLEDFELSYTSEGEGRDVLFLHGFPSNMFFWDDILTLKSCAKKPK